MRQIGTLIQDQNFNSASTDQVVAIQQNNWAHEPTDLTDVLPFVFFVTSGDLAVQSNKIANPVKKGNASENKMIRGPQTIGGGLTITGSISDSGPLLHAWYTQSLNPEWTILGGTGQTYPSTVTVIDDTADLTATGAATIADDLSSTDNPVRLQVRFHADEIRIVDAQNLAPGTALTLADNLSSTGTDVEGMLPVEVSLASATLSDPAVPGTIVIVYQDPDGNSQTATYTFANNALATPQTQTLNIDEVTSVTPTGFAAGTATVDTINPTTVALDSGVTEASLEIWGTDYWDRQIVEEIPVNSTNLLESQTTDLYFKTVTHVFAATSASHLTVPQGGSRVQGWSDGNYSIVANDTATHVTVRPQDRKLARFMAVEYAKGENPNMYYGLIPNTVTFSISREAARTDTITFLGRRGLPNTNLAKEGIVYDPNGVTTYPEKTDISSVTRTNFETYSGWQAELQLDRDEPEAATDFSMTLENGLSDAGIVSGEVYNVAEPVRDGLRMLTISATVRSSREQDYWELFSEGLTIPDVKIIFRNNQYGGFPVEEAWIFPTAEITASVDPATTGQSSITVSLEIKAFDESFGDPNDYRIESKIPRYTAPRIYT